MPACFLNSLQPKFLSLCLRVYEEFVIIFLSVSSNNMYNFCFPYFGYASRYHEALLFMNFHQTHQTHLLIIQDVTLLLAKDFEGIIPPLSPIFSTNHGITHSENLETPKHCRGGLRRLLSSSPWATDGHHFRRPLCDEIRQYLLCFRQE